MKRRFVTPLLLAGLCATGFAFAQAPASRLDRIRDTGTLVVGHSESAVPFSYVDATGPKGYGVDLSLRIAQALQKELGLEKLNIRWNPATLTTRFPLMTTNTVDLACTTTTHTREREKMVGFSTTFHIENEGIASRANSGIKSIADLSGKRIAVVRNTTTEASLRARGLGAQLVLERSNRRAMAAVVEGSADAYVAATSLVSAQQSLLEKANDYQVVSTGSGREAYACVLPQGDAAFKAVVDRTIVALMKSGEMEQLYRRWFEQPIPPLDKALHLPLGEDDKALFQAPNDLVID